MKRRCLHCSQPLQAGTCGRFCSTCVLHIPLVDLRRDELVAAVREMEAKRRRMRLQVVYGGAT